jgi:pyruvate/2-oxoglutarate dehydrogenase complex dihydrolipoamide dehydrogenase (E3) component
MLFKIPATRRDALAPRVTYSSPELASVGLSEDVAREKFRDVRIARWSLAENDRAQAERATEGFLKVVTRKNGAVLGATIVSDDAGEQIGLWSFIIANRLNISGLTKYIAPYPTRGEVSKRAGGAFFTPSLFSNRTRNVVRILSSLD